MAHHAVVVAVLYAPEKDHRQKQQDDEIAVARGKAAAQILDAHNKQCSEREKRNDIPRRMACLSDLLNIAVGIKWQRNAPFPCSYRLLRRTPSVNGILSGVWIWYAREMMILQKRGTPDKIYVDHLI